MELGLAGKVAVVTGASKGIGLAVARALAAEGTRVVAGARTITPELAALRDEKPVEVVRVDLATADGPAELVREALARGGGIDILVTTHRDRDGSEDRTRSRA